VPVISEKVSEFRTEIPVEIAGSEGEGHATVGGIQAIILVNGGRPEARVDPSVFRARGVLQPFHEIPPEEGPTAESLLSLHLCEEVGPADGHALVLAVRGRAVRQFPFVAPLVDFRMGNEDTVFPLLRVGSQKSLVGDFEGARLDVPELAALMALVDLLFSAFDGRFQFALGIEKDLLVEPEMPGAADRAFVVFRFFPFETAIEPVVVFEMDQLVLPSHLGEDGQGEGGGRPVVGINLVSIGAPADPVILARERGPESGMASKD